MGTYTHFKIHITGADNANQMVKLAAELNLTEYEIVGETGTELVSEFDDKWYRWEDEMKDASMAFPKMLIEVDGYSEYVGDIWKARIRDGQSEVIRAKIVFDDFKTIK